MLLARQVMAFRAASGPVVVSPAQALLLARELGGLLDELTIDGVELAALDNLVDAQYAEHWQHVLKFLRILRDFWPRILAERGMIDGMDRRNRLLRLQAASWTANPPTTPVIVAGTTGSQPATRDLLRAVAALPQGCIVLPGLDRQLEPESWAALDASHPQYGLRELLAALDCAREAVVDWPSDRTPDPGRHSLLSELMRPAETTDIWSTRRRPSPEALAHVVRVDCANEQQEAVVAALAMRQVLDHETRTAALVTPDRELARRVASELARWRIDVDDSAGLALADTPPAGLLRLIATAASRDFAPVALLALLKHPLCAAGLARAGLLDAARWLDRRILRGPTPAPGLASLQALAARPEAADRAAAAQILLDRLQSALAPLTVLLQDSTVKPAALMRATLQAGEALAATDREAGAAILWSGDAGERLAQLAAELLPQLDELEPIAPRQWPALLGTLMQGAVVRPRQGRHARLAIWGPLEARLQRADLVILGGLNEGTWPRLPSPGPWLSRPMRQQLGLPQPERRIGQAAHDFISAFAAGEVMLLRAERAEGAPTVPARWLARLDALLGYDPADTTAVPEYILRGRTWRDWAEALDRPAVEAPWPRPEPRPPVAARPRRLSVSAIEQWRRDPYGLYARRILKLQLLDPLQQIASAAERGQALHALLDTFVQEFPTELPPDAVKRLQIAGETGLAALLQSPTERAFWWPRFLRLARWFVDTERSLRQSGRRTVAVERDGHFKLMGPAGAFEITARADRIDRAADGGIEIVDYKSGRVPSTRELDACFSPQLLLEAAMLQAGGFVDLASDAPVGLAYWQIDGRGVGGRLRAIENAIRWCRRCSTSCSA